MSRCVIDTNVAIVANGRPDPGDAHPPSATCRLACIDFLTSVMEGRTVLLDYEGAIETEYRRHLNPKRQPGVGDRFYLALVSGQARLVEHVHLLRRPDGQYAALPQAVIDAKFDPSDRKFAALAAQEGAPVVNATDSDWLEHRQTLEQHGISLEFLCGCEKANWFTT